MSQLEMFGLNINLLIGLLLFVVIGIAMLIALWVGVKILLFRRAQQRGADEDARRKFDTDGQPLPPIGEGICHQCGQAFRRVYHMPSGQRLCPDCYKIRRPSDPYRGIP